MPVRVAIVTESFLPSANGVTTSVLRVLDHLRLRGHDAIVVCPGPAPSEYNGFPVMQCQSTHVKGFRTALPNIALRDILLDFQPDVLHAASPFVLGAQALWLARRNDIPSVAIFQTDVAGFARRNRLTATANAAWKWLAIIHNNADLNLAPSSATMRDLKKWGIERTAYWGRGVDTTTYDPARRNSEACRALRERIGPDRVAVGYIGRLAPEKSVERLADLAQFPQVRLVLVGEGPSRPTLEHELAHTDALFLGRLDGEELATAYASLDIFVHTGENETFGQTLQEAMASGVPVVAPASGGPLDIVDHGRTGLLYAPGDQLSLNAAVHSLTRDDAARVRMGQAGRAKVEPRSWEALGDQLLDYYSCVMTPTDRTVLV